MTNCTIFLRVLRGEDWVAAGRTAPYHPAPGHGLSTRMMGDGAIVSFACQTNAVMLYYSRVVIDKNEPVTILAAQSPVLHKAMRGRWNIGARP
jgi:hypothetical protein